MITILSQEIFNLVKESIMITCFVLVMMIIVEYLTILTNGNWSKKLSKNNWLQIPLATVLGILPGCLGSYTAVTMYSHRIFSFSALITVTIATIGDEAFFMYSILPPQKAILITSIIGITAIIGGVIISFFEKRFRFLDLHKHEIHLHQNNSKSCVAFDSQLITKQLKRLSFQRILLLTIGSILLVFLLNGETGHIHSFEEQDTHSEHNHWGALNYILLLTNLVVLFIFATVSDHFLSHHLWDHIIKKHSVRIFLWTFGALFFIHFMEDFINVKEWIDTKESRYFVILAIAILIGIIPESGPHIIFFVLYANGTIPLSILLANSIVQDGHGALPLLAESRKSFIMMKAVKIIFGVLVAVGFHLFQL